MTRLHILREPRTRRGAEARITWREWLCGLVLWAIGTGLIIAAHKLIGGA